MPPAKRKSKPPQSIARLSRSDFFNDVSKESKLNRRDVESALSAVAKVTKKVLKGGKKLDIPGVCSLRVVKKPATKAGRRLQFGKMVQVKAKPASNVTKCRPAADLKKL